MTIIPTPFFLAFGIFLIQSLNAEPEPFTGTDFLDVAEIHHWHFQIPHDLAEDEHAGLLWDINDRIEKNEGGDDVAYMKTVPGNVNFDGIPPGTWVKLFLWLDEFPAEKETAPESLKYAVRYRDPKTIKNRIKKGRLQLPDDDRYVSVYGCQASGNEADGAWFLMLTGIKKYSQCFLNLGFWTDGDYVKETRKKEKLKP